MGDVAASKRTSVRLVWAAIHEKHQHPTGIIYVSILVLSSPTSLLAVNVARCYPVVYLTSGILSGTRVLWSSSSG